MGWMSNWQYANQVPTERWRNAMTLPRELKLNRDKKGFLLRSVPVVETKKLRGDPVKLDPGPIKGRTKIGPAIEAEYPIYEIDLLFKIDSSFHEQGEGFGFILESKMNEQVVVAFNPKTKMVFMGRLAQSGNVDFSEHFTGFHHAPYEISELGEIRFHAFVDLSSIELFVDQGAVVMTELVFPESGFASIHLYGDHESVQLKDGVIYSLNSIW